MGECRIRMDRIGSEFVVVYTVTVLFVSQVLDGLPVPVQRAAAAARGI